MKHVEYFECEKCANRYSTEAAALECEARPAEGRVDGVTVGSLVFTPGQFWHWWDSPDKRWCIPIPRDEVSLFVGYETDRVRMERPTAYFKIYIVTAITDSDHHLTYHLLNPCGPEGTTQHRWTRLKTHIRIKPVPADRLVTSAVDEVPNILAALVDPQTRELL